MLPSLCPGMAVNPSVSRLYVPAPAGTEGRRRRGDRPPGRPTRIVGFHGACWQHRCLDCGTLNSERSLRSRHLTSCRRRAVAGKEPPVAGACMVGEVLG